MSSVKIYQYKKCSTCVKALKFLDKGKVAYIDVDIILKPPTKKELQFMLNQYDGEIKKLFNTSGVQYRELSIKDTIKTMSPKQAIDMLSKNGKLVKRPFLLTEKAGRVGFKEDEWKAIFK